MWTLLASGLALLSLASCKITITEPKELEGELDHELSLFGFVDYQASTIVEIFPWSTESGCEPPTEEIFRVNSSHPKGFLMRRGGCKFLQQALNGHRVGARMVLVYRDNDDDIHGSYVGGGTNDVDHKHHMIPPVVEISKQNGLKIKQALEAGKSVKLWVDYEMKTYDPPVTVKFVFSPSDFDAIQTLIKLFKASTNITKSNKKKHSENGLMILIPIPKLYTAEDLKLPPNEQKLLCLPNVDLCAAPNKKRELIDAREEILLASLFTCVFESAGKDRTMNEQILEFLTKFSNNVRTSLTSRIPLTEQMTFVFDSTKLAQQTKQCIDSNLGKYSNFDDLQPTKQFIDKMIIKSQQFNVKVPAMYIQNQLVRGDLTPLTAVSAFCDVLKEKLKPEWCSKVTEELDAMIKFELDVPAPEETMNMFATSLAVIVLTVILIVIVCLLAKRMLKSRVHEDINQEVNNSLERYYQIQNTKISVMDRDTELAPNHA